MLYVNVAKQSKILLVFFLQINVRVTTMDAELEFAIQPNTTGKQLFDQVSMSDITTNVDRLLLSKKAIFYRICLSCMHTVFKLSNGL